MNYKEIAKEIVEIVNKQDSLYDAVDLVEEYLKKKRMLNTYSKIFFNSNDGFENLPLIHLKHP